MDDDSVDENKDEWPISLLNNQFSSIYEKQFLVRAEYSFDGKSYQEFVMKHDSGATHVGVPLWYLSQPPKGIEMKRNEDLTVHTPFGKKRQVSYKNQFILWEGR